jgi:hypothetical protein
MVGPTWTMTIITIGHQAPVNPHTETAHGSWIMDHQSASLFYHIVNVSVSVTVLLVLGGYGHEGISRMLVSHK